MVPNACAAHQPPLPSRGALGLHSGRCDGSQGRQPVGVTFAFPVSPAGIWFLLSLSLHITVISGLMPLKSPFYCLPRCNEERSKPKCKRLHCIWPRSAAVQGGTLQREARRCAGWGWGRLCRAGCCSVRRASCISGLRPPRAPLP